MPNEKTDSAGFATVNTDKERSESAIGDTTTSIGVPGDKHTAANTVDTATSLAANSKKPENGDNVGEKDN
jgi:hypothetical protein